MSQLLNFLSLFANKSSEANIDNLVFKLHYKFTKMILILCTMIVSGSQILGNPIHCAVKGVRDDVMDAHCWIHSTFTLPYSSEQKIGIHMAHPGVTTNFGGKSSVNYHTYYQWIPLLSVLQAGLFYAPHYLWKNLEDKQVLSAIKRPIQSTKKKNSKATKLHYVICYYFFSKQCKQIFYLYGFLLCEFLNLCNVIFQIIILDYFLNNEFTNYGFKLIDYLNDPYKNVDDSFSSLFPKLSKCSFHKYGPSGTLQNIDGLCMLPLNIMNEKIYIFLWFWFYTLSIITALWFIFEIVILCNFRLRYSFLKAKARNIKPETVHMVVKKLDLGKWFFLYQLSKNIKTSKFCKLLKLMQRKCNK